MQLLDNSTPLVGFDTETTGVDVFSDETRIVTCAFIMSPGEDQPNQTLEWMMDPGMEIPTEASDVHGISTETAREHGMDYKEGLQKIADTLSYTIQSGIPLTAYNGAFDATLLRVEFLRVGVDFDDNLWNNMILLDPLIWDKYLDPWRKGKRTLSVVTELHGYYLSNAHDAASDVFGTIHLCRKLLPKLIRKVENQFNHPVSSYADLMQIQSALFRKQATSLEEYFQRTKPETVINKSWPFQDDVE